MATKQYNSMYQKSPAGKVAITRQYHAKNYAPLTAVDNFDGVDLQMLWLTQGGKCAACGCDLPDLNKAEIDHISPNSNFNFHFLQLLCKADNIAKRDLIIPFAFFEENYGRSFYQYFLDDRDQIIEWFRLDSNDVKRIEKRINQLLDNGG
jgi:hypothetical protein